MSELEQLIAISRTNEEISRKLFTIETEILSCQSSQELLKKLLGLVKTSFQLTDIFLLLADPTPISYLLTSKTQSQWHQDNTQRINTHKLQKLHPNNMPLLTNNISLMNDILPQHLRNTTGSIALIPVTLEGQFFGSLLFMDNKVDRFTEDLGTFHLEQLAVKISLCLSNVLIREQLEYMAHYDRLTGIANRRLMEKCIDEELVRQRRYQVPFSVLFIDLNKFKIINDTYGHDCGDKVLAYVATQLQELIRENDKCFRYAGDEFVVVLASQTYQEAKSAAHRLCQFFINNPMPYQNSILEVTISCGAAASDGILSMDQLLKKADEQLYLHKKVTAKS
ncbi:MAG: GGDEF domain-containing protein [Thalassotalea sp.]